MAQVLRLDPIRCDGYGVCAVHLPERITLDEWGYPIIDPTPVHGSEHTHAKRAVNACPRRSTTHARAGIRPARTGA